MHKITPEENQSHNQLEDWNIEDKAPEEKTMTKNSENALSPNAGGGGDMPPVKK
ncbi:hypothetical protein [Algicola sagamiensis]|uniref:hypothetical protein n=1 Tax=Algicola sagamiensis TaxID=163869 RepID=UPI000365FAD3|nr:hypothetical protein [Algicola sagamiensis]